MRLKQKLTECGLMIVGACIALNVGLLYEKWWISLSVMYVVILVDELLERHRS